MLKSLFSRLVRLCKLAGSIFAHKITVAEKRFREIIHVSCTHPVIEGMFRISPGAFQKPVE